jgi:hypothetical protein
MYAIDLRPPSAIKVLFLGCFLALAGLGACLFASMATGLPSALASFVTNACLVIASVGGNLVAASALFKTQINQASSPGIQAGTGNGP